MCCGHSSSSCWHSLSGHTSKSWVVLRYTLCYPLWALCPGSVCRHAILPTGYMLQNPQSYSQAWFFCEQLGLLHWWIQCLPWDVLHTSCDMYREGLLIFVHASPFLLSFPSTTSFLLPQLIVPSLSCQRKPIVILISLLPTLAHVCPSVVFVDSTSRRGGVVTTFHPLC